jgi:small subunit ribosomal protein S2
MSRLPAALFVVDIKAEHINNKAQKLNIPVLQWLILTLILVSRFVIPSNDDASKSIDKILSLVTAAIVEGLSDRGSDKETDATEKSGQRQ